MTLTLLPNRPVSAPTECAGPTSLHSDSVSVDPTVVAELAKLRGALCGGGLTIGLSGLDGSGKSTLARQLAAVLEAAGYPVRVRHLFSWHTNLWHTPRLIARRGKRTSEVQIFDRGIYDNLAGLLARAPRWAWLTRATLRLTARRYPGCDLQLLLQADWPETQARRPKTMHDEYTRFTNAYRVVGKTLDWQPLRSDGDALATAIEHLRRILRIKAASRTAIIHADDLGLTYAFNEGIRRAHHAGVLTSTSLRANGWAYRHAVENVLPTCPRLGVGLHLCLNEAEPVAPSAEVPRLLDGSGKLRSGFVWLIRAVRTSSGRAQIECELRTQIEKVLSDGVRIAHLDAHQHVHMIPTIFHIVCRLACEYGIDCVRLTHEPRYSARGWRRRFEPLLTGNAIKHVLLNHYARRNRKTARAFGMRSPDAFVGVNYTGAMDVDTVCAGLAAAGDGVVEVLLHPAIGPDPRDVTYPAEYLREYVCCRQRRTELTALTAPELADRLREKGWRLADYAGALGARRLDQPPAHTPIIDSDVRALFRKTAARNPLWVSKAQADARAFAEVVLSQVKQHDRVLDLGTGSGILAIGLAKAGIEVVATDISAGAVQTAQRNAQTNGVSFACLVSDLLDAVTDGFDVIAFNIPYNFGPDTLLSNVAKNIARRIPWVCRNSGAAIPHAVLHYHRELIGRLFSQVFTHLLPGGCLLLHVFDFEAGIFRRMLPECTTVEVLHHPEFRAHRTVAMLIRTQGDPTMPRS